MISWQSRWLDFSNMLGDKKTRHDELGLWCCLEVILGKSNLMNHWFFSTAITHMHNLLFTEEWRFCPVDVTNNAHFPLKCKQATWYARDTHTCAFAVSFYLMRSLLIWKLLTYWLTLTLRKTSRGLSHPGSQFELRWSPQQDKWDVVISVSFEESVTMKSKERIDFPLDFPSKQNPFPPHTKVNQVLKVHYA